MRNSHPHPLALAALLVFAALGGCSGAAPAAPRAPLETGASAAGGRSMWGSTARPDLQVPDGRYALVSVNDFPMPFPRSSALYSGAIWRDAGLTIGRTETTVTGRNSASALGFQAATIMGVDGSGHFGVLLRWTGAPADAQSDSAVWSADTVRVRVGAAYDSTVGAGDELLFVRER